MRKGSASGDPLLAEANSASPGHGRLATPLNAAASDVVMLVNRIAGAAGGSSPVGMVEADLSEHGFTVHLCDSFDQLRGIAAELHAARRLRAAIAVGGDGTVGAVLNATPAGTPIAVVPTGTENLLAKYLKIDRNPAALIERVSSGVAISLDACEATVPDQQGRLFALMISVGLDAEVVHRVHRKRTGNITHLAYAKPTINLLRTYKYPKIRAKWQDSIGIPHEADGRWLFGINLPRYAQGLPIAPAASGSDGLLDLCLFRRGYVVGALWYLWHILRRRHHLLRSVTTARCTEVTIESPSAEPIAFQLDGDPGGVLPVSVRVLPNRLTLLVDTATAKKFGFTLSQLPNT